jgi:hypothetical protein
MVKHRFAGMKPSPERHWPVVGYASASPDDGATDPCTRLGYHTSRTGGAGGHPTHYRQTSSHDNRRHYGTEGA